ncbi:hypothetical protein [Undibacterium sp. WLHG33]|uniref:hypothetical protein n=1 Tax=Undibacterium sp. WLHG33 TaxID=3412482 RepID=UPI003C2D8CE8
MTTANHTDTPTNRAKPSYSAMRYDFAYMDWMKPTKVEPRPQAEYNETIGDAPSVDDAPTKLVSSEKRNTKKPESAKFKLKKKQFHGALLDIFTYGMECNRAIATLQATIAEPISNAAIPGLAKILGIYREYFDNTEGAERDKLFQILVQKCRTNFGKSTVIKSDKRTTEWHLLSRMFRQSERRQASSDAKILKFAHAEGVTEETFASWVEKHGTLSKILRSVPNESEETCRKVSKPKPFLRWITAAQVQDTNPQEALDALMKLADGKVYKIAITHHHGMFDITREEAAPTTKTEKQELSVSDEVSSDS